MSGERAIDRTLERWVRARSGSDVLARAAWSASGDEGAGHVCSALDGFSTDEVAELRAHAWVGDGSRFTPFVLDGTTNFYAWRNWRHETRVAHALLGRARARALPLRSTELAAALDELFAGGDPHATRWQRAAVAAVPGSRVFVLTGGPGTGKTTTVLRMLLMLLRHAQVCDLPIAARVVLAAPTGKAAQRLDEAIAVGKQRLRDQLGPHTSFRALLDGVPDSHARTLHRLLGFRPHDNSFEFGAHKPLAADIVVVDEASMIDIGMMRRLLDALRPDTMLILLGDPGQLHAIEAGSVLSDIAGSAAENAMSTPVAELLTGVLGAELTSSAAPLAGQVVTLTHVWRAGSQLQSALDALRRGDAGWLDASNAAVCLRSCADPPALRAQLEAWIDAHPVYVDLMRPDMQPPAALARLREAQILCALRDGTFGVAGINARVGEMLAQRGGDDTSGDWYHGRPVIITRNDYTRELYNGDIGIALRVDNDLRVWFTGAAGLRSFSPRTLPAHDTAWAITIHRSQGSEYRDVAVVLPTEAESRVLSRELLYTAVSRATESAQIWTSPEAVRAAAEHHVRRRGGLRARLTASSPGP